MRIAVRSGFFESVLRSRLFVFVRFVEIAPQPEPDDADKPARQKWNAPDPIGIRACTGGKLKADQESRHQRVGQMRENQGQTNPAASAVIRRRFEDEAGRARRLATECETLSNAAKDQQRGRCNADARIRGQEPDYGGAERHQPDGHRHDFHAAYLVRHDAEQQSAERPCEECNRIDGERTE